MAGLAHPPEDRIEIVKGRLVVRILRVPSRMASEQPRANLGDGERGEKPGGGDG